MQLVKPSDPLQPDSIDMVHMPAPDLPQTEIAIVEMTNAFRKENRLGRRSSRMRRSPRPRARSPTTSPRAGKFAHEADGRKPADARRGPGLPLLPGGGEPRAQPRQPRLRDQAARRATPWRAGRTRPAIAPTCCAPHVTEIGVAVVRAPDRDPKFISVQLFGRPDVAEGRVLRSTIAPGRPVRYQLGDDKHHAAPTHHRHPHALQPATR